MPSSARQCPSRPKVLLFALRAQARTWPDGRCARIAYAAAAPRFTSPLHRDLRHARTSVLNAIGNLIPNFNRTPIQWIRVRNLGTGQPAAPAIRASSLAILLSRSVSAGLQPSTPSALTSPLAHHRQQRLEGLPPNPLQVTLLELLVVFAEHLHVGDCQALVAKLQVGQLQRAQVVHRLEEPIVLGTRHAV